MTGKFGIGLVGLGFAVTPHLRALRDLSDTIAVRGVYSRNRERREAFAAEHGYKAAESYAALLADAELDAVILLTPPNQRLELVEQAARAKKHIFMEKPVERTTEAAERIVALCEQAGIRLGITFQHRFREGALKARELLASGALGELATAYLVVPWWRSADYYSEPGRGTFAQDGGGVLITQAVHSLDLMLSLTGQAETVAAIAGTSRLHRIEVEDFVGAGVRFRNGALGSIMATTAAYPGAQEYMVFCCTRGTATLSGSVLTIAWQDGRREVHGMEASTGGGEDRMAFPHDWHRSQIAEFVEAVQGGRDPVSNGRTALEVHYLIDALLASAREGRAMSVKTGGR
ncbi:MAG: Gfo/Idh/MocA family oxidoreductase [Alphaproteobacteria bacterium]|nr:Gfo/Idh/MocA family oxidoreductase [Alphaproteobacteria bacterium]